MSCLLRLLRKVIFVMIAFSNMNAQEICDNGIDDDGDGLIDLNDEDCSCFSCEKYASLLPNYDFEDNLNCPANYTQMDICNNWEQVSDGTSDYLNYCGFTSKFHLPENNFNCGDGFVGFINSLTRSPYGTIRVYKEYIGTTLNESLLPGKVYKLKFLLGFTKGRISYYNPNVFEGSAASINISIFGSSSLNFKYYGYECPLRGAGGFVELGSTKISGFNEWVEAEIIFSPTQEIKSFVVGPDCIIGTALDTLEYYFLDRLILMEESKFGELRDKKEILEIGNYCENSLMLRCVPNEGEKVQWYKDGIALIGDTLNFIKIDTSEWGTYQYIITRNSGACESSNNYIIDSLIRSDCYAPIIIYIPNSFSPNNDGFNDVFVPKISLDEKIKDYSLQIFNKWGKEVFTTNEPVIGWDGTFLNKPCQPDVYIWKLKYRDSRKAEIINKTGHVSLVK